MLKALAPALPNSAAVQVLPYRGLVSLAAYKGQAGALRAALGVKLPATPRRVVAGDTSYLWAGPDAWLAMSEDPALFDEMSRKAAGLAAITAQSDGHVIFRVIGPNVRAALAKLVPIDLHEAVFPPDGVALTLAAHIGVKLWQEEDGAFALACFASFASALHHALVEATDSPANLI